ncbi:MAG: hypothetical protein H6828_13140 [Planctomycetes bacterium]|nr:hypothetical protein [Planctomycetota bacterium]
MTANDPGARRPISNARCAALVLVAALASTALPAWVSTLLRSLRLADVSRLLWTAEVLLWPVVLVPGLLLFRWRPGRRVQVLALLLGSAAGLAAARPVIPWAAFPAEAGLRDVVPEVAPVVDAVEAYRRDHGALPATLEALVPEYLDALPGVRPAWYGLESRYAPGDPWTLSFDTYLALGLSAPYGVLEYRSDQAYDAKSEGASGHHHTVVGVDAGWCWSVRY